MKKEKSKDAYIKALKLSRMVVSDLDEDNLTHFVNKFKTYNDDTVELEFGTPDSTIAGFFNKFTENGFLNLGSLFNGLKKNNFSKSKEGLSAALFTLILRSKYRNAIWGYAVKKSEPDSVDLFICHIGDEENFCTPIQEVSIPEIISKKNLAERIEIGTTIVRKKLQKNYARSKNPLSLLVLCQVGFSHESRNKIYQNLREDLVKQKNFTEVWFLYFNGVQKEDLELSAEKIFPDDKVFAITCLLKQELSRYLIRGGEL